MTNRIEKQVEIKAPVARVWRALTDCREYRFFSFTWHPYAVDQSVDYSKETPTLIEFHLEKTSVGTLLKLAETGFDKVPAHRREEAYRMNERGWTEQMANIKNFIAKKP